MRGLTILQPYLGMKIVRALFGPECDRGHTVEFRNRRTNVRQLVALRAGADHIPCSTCPVGWRGECDEYWPRCYEQPEAHAAEWARSAIVATAGLVDCRRVVPTDRDFPGFYAERSGYYAWVLRGIVILPKPLAYKPPRGAQTWFTVPPEVEAEVLRQAAQKGEGGHDE